MSEQLIKSIHELLNEEKWTRAALNSYTINNFKELDDIILKTDKFKVQEEILSLCQEHLAHTKNSIIALYLSGVISLSKQLVDDSNLIVLTNIFTDNHKWNIVEYLCKRILEFGENKYALRTLAECYENKNEEENKFKVWERFIRVDYEEADIVRFLAEKEEKDNNLEKAIEYYKKAMHRYINKKMFANVKGIWEKLIEYSPEDIEFFFHIERKIVKVLSGERAGGLLYSLYPYYNKIGNWDTAIEILKRVLAYESKNPKPRKDIVECYRKKYDGHSHLEEYIKLSNLTQSWRNVHDAISDFEKHISFDTGNYVYHRSWGIGKVINIEDELFFIDFADKKNHQMSLKMAVKALSILTDDHIWVLKNSLPASTLKNKIKQEPSWALKILIRSFDNMANMKKIKSELVPSILTAGEWSKWNMEAQKILKTDPIFGNHPDKIDMFMVRETPISFEEKTFNKFKAEKNFYGRVEYIQDFLKHGKLDSEYFGEMFSYFTAFLKSFSIVNELVISSYLLITRIVAAHPYLNPGFNYKFVELFEQIDNLDEVFSKITESDFKKDFLVYVKKNIDNWPEIFARLFNLYQSKYIIDELVSSGEMEVLKTISYQLLMHYRELKEPFIWVARNLTVESWFVSLNIPLEKILIAMIHLLDITYREISNKREVSLNRKLNKQIQDFLFKEEKLINYILNSGEESITRLYTLIDDVKEMDPSLKINLKQKIRDKYPDYKFLGEPEKERVSWGLTVTKSGYEKKQKALRHLLEVEIPVNSKEIGEAMEKGDLRENAEYKAALEKQELLKGATLKIQEELQNARIFNESQIDTDYISFGTRVKLKNKISNKKEEYIILGPWESEPSKQIISYLSPLGVELCNHRAGENLQFTINEREYSYQVDSIDKVDL